MLEKKDHVKRIQEITFEAYKSSGRIAALLDQNTGPSEQLSEELERVAAQIEHGAIDSPGISHTNLSTRCFPSSLHLSV